VLSGKLNSTHSLVFRLFCIKLFILVLNKEVYITIILILMLM